MAAPGLSAPAARGYVSCVPAGGKQAGIEPQPADERCPRGYGMGELMDGKAAVADEDNAPAWKPATELQGVLARPVGQQLLAAPGFVVSPFGRRQQGQDRESLCQACPRHRGKDHEAQPAQTAGFDEMPMTGAHGISVYATRADPAAPSAFDRIIHADDDGAVWNQPLDHKAQQTPGDSAGAPAGSVEDLVIACKVGSLCTAGHAQAGTDGSLSRRQKRAHDKHKDMFPTGGSRNRDAVSATTGAGSAERGRPRGP